MTGGGVYEYFKNGISKLLIPNDILCSRQSDLKDEMVCKAIREFSQVRKLIEDLPDPMSREARKLYLTIIGLIAKEITEASKLAKSAIDKVAEFDECIEILTGRLYGVDYKKCKIDEAD